MSTVVLLLAVLTFTACDDEPDGAYTLVSIDGDQLPVVGEGIAVTAGGVEIREDSLIWTETIVLGYRTPSPQALEMRTATAYEVDGNVIRALPEAFTIPDDLFVQCVTGGVYRIHDGGTTLRMIDVVMDGECDGLEPFEVLERVYRRD